MGHGVPLLRMWKNAGVWTCLQRAIYENARTQAGRSACPSLVIMDGQSVKTTERSGVRGFDGHKRVKGRKLHILVDTRAFRLRAESILPTSLTDAQRSFAQRTTATIPGDPDSHGRCRS